MKNKTWLIIYKNEILHEFNEVHEFNEEDVKEHLQDMINDEYIDLSQLYIIQGIKLVPNIKIVDLI